MSDTETELVKFEEEISPLSGGELLHAPADQFSSAEAVAAYSFIQHIEKVVGARRKELRTRILKDAAIIEAGKVTDAGGTSTNVRGTKVQRRKSTKMFADESKIRAVLAAKGLDESAVFDDKKVTLIQKVVNPSKIAHLFETGVFTEKEVESFHKVSWTLVVTPSSKISNMLEAADERAQSERKLLDFANPPNDL